MKIVEARLPDSITEVKGIFLEGADEETKTYSYRKIPQEYKDFMTGKFSNPDNPLEAVFIVSDNGFENLQDVDGICWQLTAFPILYIDTIIINPTTETRLIYDVISDLIIEEAICKQAKTLRVGMKKSSKITDVLLNDERYIWMGEDDEYSFFEVDVEKEEADIEEGERGMKNKSVPFLKWMLKKTRQTFRKEKDI